MAKKAKPAPLPATLRLLKRLPQKAYLDAWFWVPKDAINVEGTKLALTTAATTARSARVFALWQEREHHLLVPRLFYAPGAFGDLEIVDLRPLDYPTVDITSRIELDKYKPEERHQHNVVEAMHANEGGIIQLRCGGGKTVCALEYVAQTRQPALIIVPETQLLEQWAEEIAQHLHIPEGVGYITPTKFDWKKPIVLATYGIIARRAHVFPEEARRWFATILFDEGHHLPAATWSAACALGYGKRFILTATPERADGMHLINKLHVGPVLYKNLKQDVQPEIQFVATGCSLDMNDKDVEAQVTDVLGEIHFGMLARYLGSLRERLEFLMQGVMDLYKQGRRIIVISNSRLELINLFAIWCGKPLFSDQDPIDVVALGFPPGTIPRGLAKEKRNKIQADLIATKESIEKKSVESPNELAVHRKRRLSALHTLQTRLARYEQQLLQRECYKAVMREEEKRIKQYVEELLALNTDAGILIGAVGAKKRRELLANKRLSFVLSRFGKEGLNEKRLNTLVVSQPIPDEGALRQVLGRIQRLSSEQTGLSRLALFLEDSIDPYLAMCQKVRRHLRAVPPEDGGPLSYIEV